MKTIVKTRFFKPVFIGSDNINILVYELFDEKWSENTIRSRENILDKLLIIAQNMISMLDSSGELRDRYVFVEVEYPGLKASRGDGLIQNTEVMIFPTPQPLKAIIFLKKEGNELKEVERLVFKQEKWIYESILRINNIDFDAILVESIENKRIILREEILSPKIYVVKETETRKRRRIRARKRKTSKSRSRKKSRKSKRRKKRRKSKQSSRK